MPILLFILSAAGSALRNALAFAASPVGRVVTLVVMVGLYVHHLDTVRFERLETAEKAQREHLADVERQRREAAIADAQRQAKAQIDVLTAQNQNLAELLKDAENASHANDRKPCLDAGGVRRLNRIR